MGALRHSGWRQLGVATLLAASTLVRWSTPATAAYADECAAPTRTLTGGSSDGLAVDPGETVLLALGTYTGGIEHLADDARLCVAADAALNPPWFDRAAGSLLVQGSATLPGFTTDAPFVLDNEGTVTITGSINTNQAAELRNRAGATLAVDQSLVLSNGSVLANAGTLDLPAGLTLNHPSTVDNTGTMTAASLIAGGTVSNAGTITLAGDLQVNSGAELRNECRITITTGNASLNGPTTNHGALTVGAHLTNNDTFTQSPTGITLGTDLTNDRTVSGFGRFLFTGDTRTQGQFVGDDASHPIVFFDASLSGAIFDTASGTVANVVRAEVPVPPDSYRPPGCADGGATADLVVAKSGPATVAAGGTVTYTVEITNHGPGTADDVVVQDALPATLSGVSSSPSGTITSEGLTWVIDSLAPDATAAVTVTGTAPPEGTLVNVVSASAATDDPDPANNDGTQPSAVVTTQVVPTPPANSPPVVDDLALTTTANDTVFGTVPHHDPDAGQRVTLRLVTPPASGTARVQPGGVLAYAPAADFTGRVTFEVEGCDNGEPVRCDRGTVTVAVAPVAPVEGARTTEGTPVGVPVLTRVEGDSGPPAITAGPANGTAAVGPDGAVTYTPAPGFTGIDRLSYQVCSPTAPDVCDDSAILVLVTPPPNHPPVADDLALTTPAEVAVTGRVPLTDPDAGQTVTASLTTAPVAGTATVAPDGTVTYTPPPDFSGVVTFTVAACDDGQPVRCDPATVTVTVGPRARIDIARSPAGSQVTIPVLANDLGVTGPPALLGLPIGGAALVVGDTIVYTPAPGTEVDLMRYQVCSPEPAAGCSTASVLVLVDAPPDQPPVIEDEVRATHADAPVSGAVRSSDPEGQLLTHELSGPPAEGTAVVSPDGAWTYTPAPGFAGVDIFEVLACEPPPGSLCSVGTVTVIVQPVAAPDAASTRVGLGVLIPVGANDVGGEVTEPDAPTHGGASERVEQVWYRPEPGWTGIDHFGYTSCAPGYPSICTHATVVVTVTPAAVDDDAVTRATAPVAVAVTGNDHGDAAPPALGVAPTHGTLAPMTGGWWYQPTGTSTGYDHLTYRICSPTNPLVCDDAVATIRVLPAPADDTATTTAGTAVTIPVEANDVGDAGLPLLVAPPARGTITVEADGTIRYVPAPGFVGTDRFTYRVCSPTAPDLCASATVTVAVTDPSDEDPPGPGPGPEPEPPPEPEPEPEPSEAVAAEDVVADADADADAYDGDLPMTGGSPLPLLTLAAGLLLAGVALRATGRATGR